MIDLRALALTIPTDGPESDGTLAWDSTTMVVVEARSGSHCGIGYSYTDAAAAELVGRVLAPVLDDVDPMDIPAAWRSMVDAVRNLGRPGIATAAISAVDTALWDLKARRLDLALVDLLGRSTDSIDVYGSGGFTSYSLGQLGDQLAGWAAEGIRSVKMKVGREPTDDPLRVATARDAIGAGVELYVDANGAYTTAQAQAMAGAFADVGVRWFEEPVSSDDLEGLASIRRGAPAGMEIAAGEYGWDTWYFRRMLAAGSVDVLQADATRCGGISGFVKVGALCEAFGVALSAHTAPALHVHACCAAPVARNVEWFHDHVRLEAMVFDGPSAPVDGRLVPDRSRPGLGLELKRSDVEPYLSWGDR